METIASSGRHSFQQKLFLIVETISFQWKPFLLVEAIPFSGSHSCLWKPLPLVEEIPFSGSHYFQCFNIFTSRSYQKLSEYLNINDSVRSLKMVNLSCIHIPREVFQSSERYLEPSRASGVESFRKNCWRFLFAKKLNRRCATGF